MNQSEIQQAIDYYKQQNPQLAELLNISGHIFRVQQDYASQLAPITSLSQESAIEKLKANKYLLEEIAWSINKETLEKIVKDLIKPLPDHSSFIGWSSIFSVLPNLITPRLPELIDRTNQAIKNTSPEEISLLNFVLWQTLSVFYQKQAEILQGIDYQSYWSKPICPVCGSIPKISKLLKDSGKRVLACYLCWTEWPIHRLVCPYCGNTAQDKLAYFYADGNKAYRVDVCNNCNKYLKTIDENVLGRKVVLEVEDIITYHLDTLAIKEGRQSPLFFL